MIRSTMLGRRTERASQYLREASPWISVAPRICLPRQLRQQLGHAAITAQLSRCYSATTSAGRGCQLGADSQHRLGGSQIDHAPGTSVTVPSLLDAKGAGALLNVPATWVLAEARADRIPHVRLGRYVRFDAAELHVWWQSRRRGPWRRRRTAVEPERTSADPATTDKRAA